MYVTYFDIFMHQIIFCVFRLYDIAKLLSLQCSIQYN